jgi:CheY-like chemotaxis protein
MKGATILIVEDELIVALDLQNRLRRQGYIIPATAVSGEQAVQLAEKTQPDLILMDIGLKGQLDGIEAAEQIRTRFGMPVVFLTAFADFGTMQRAQAIMSAAFISKPFADDELLNAVNAALRAGA